MHYLSRTFIPPEKKTHGIVIPIPYCGSKFNPSLIFNNQEIIQCYPKETSEAFSVAFKYDNGIRKKVLNYTSMNKAIIDHTTIECDCINNPLCDQYYKHVITGNLAVVKIENSGTYG